MITRVLPPDEWPRLVGTEAETIWPNLDPMKSRVIVVEDNGQIVGCHVLSWVLHAECLWTHPDHRGKAGVARRLWPAVKVNALEMGASVIATAANSDVVRELLAHVGAEQVLADTYVMRMH